MLVGYNQEELETTPDYVPTFSPGDVLAHRPEGSTEADGLSMVRLRDGAKDMVWPEEVELLVGEVETCEDCESGAHSPDLCPLRQTRLLKEVQ